MTNKAVSPQDLISDNDNFVILKGVQVRKGTVGAALANADVISSATATETEKEAAVNMLRELAPALAAIDICRHVTWKNATIQQMIDEAAAKL